MLSSVAVLQLNSTELPKIFAEKETSSTGIIELLTCPQKSNPQKLYVGLKGATGVGKIVRCDIDGSNQEDVATDLISIADIELDLTNRKIYWAQDTWDDDKINKADMDGLNSSIETLYSSSTTNRDL